MEQAGAARIVGLCRRVGFDHQQRPPCGAKRDRAVARDKLLKADDVAVVGGERSASRALRPTRATLTGVVAAKGSSLIFGSVRADLRIRPMRA